MLGHQQSPSVWDEVLKKYQDGTNDQCTGLMSLGTKGSGQREATHPVWDTVFKWAVGDYPEGCWSTDWERRLLHQASSPSQPFLEGWLWTGVLHAKEHSPYPRFLTLALHHPLKKQSPALPAHLSKVTWILSFTPPLQGSTFTFTTSKQNLFFFKKKGKETEAREEKGKAEGEGGQKAMGSCTLQIQTCLNSARLETHFFWWQPQLACVWLATQAAGSWSLWRAGEGGKFSFTCMTGKSLMCLNLLDSCLWSYLTLPHHESWERWWVSWLESVWICSIPAGFCSGSSLLGLCRSGPAQRCAHATRCQEFATEGRTRTSHMFLCDSSKVLPMMAMSEAWQKGKTSWDWSSRASLFSFT